MPIAIYTEIQVTFQDLCKDDDLLCKCLNRESRNANETFHQFLWRKCPKTKFASIKILKIAVSSATVNFYSEMIGLSDIIYDTEMTPG